MLLSFAHTAPLLPWKWPSAEMNSMTGTNNGGSLCAHYAMSSPLQIVRHLNCSSIHPQLESGHGPRNYPYLAPEIPGLMQSESTTIPTLTFRNGMYSMRFKRQTSTRRSLEHDHTWLRSTGICMSYKTETPRPRARQPRQQLDVS